MYVLILFPGQFPICTYLCIGHPGRQNTIVLLESFTVPVRPLKNTHYDCEDFLSLLKPTSITQALPRKVLIAVIS